MLHEFGMVEFSSWVIITIRMGFTTVGDIMCVSSVRSSGCIQKELGSDVTRLWGDLFFFLRQNPSGCWIPPVPAWDHFPIHWLDSTRIAVSEKWNKASLKQSLLLLSVRCVCVRESYHATLLCMEFLVDGAHRHFKQRTWPGVCRQTMNFAQSRIDRIRSHVDKLTLLMVESSS